MEKLLIVSIIINLLAIAFIIDQVNVIKKAKESETQTQQELFRLKSFLKSFIWNICKQREKVPGNIRTLVEILYPEQHDISRRKIVRNELKEKLYGIK